MVTSATSRPAQQHSLESLRVVTADSTYLRVERRLPQRPVEGSVCLAHGFGQTRRAWERSARQLVESGYEVICADARGHGDSDRNPPSLAYCHEQFVADVHCVGAQSSRKPVWVGASMGGLLGLMAATADKPVTPFSALVLVDITPRWDSSGVERILTFMRAYPDGFQDLDAAADAVIRFLPQRPRKSAGRLRGLLRESEDGRLRWHWDPRMLSELELEGPHWETRLAEAARRLRVPTLLISGGRSDLVGDEHVEHFLQLAPHAQHVRLPAATHMVVGDDNDAFTDTLLDFLPTVGSPTDIPHAASTGARASGVAS